MAETASILSPDKTVLIPEQNVKDLTEIPDNVKNKLEIVPVRWIVNVPQSEAYWVKGMFANQNSAGKLRQQFTLERLTAHFGVTDESDESRTTHSP